MGEEGKKKIREPAERNGWGGGKKKKK